MGMGRGWAQHAVQSVSSRVPESENPSGGAECCLKNFSEPVQVGFTVLRDSRRRFPNAIISSNYRSS